VKRFSLALILLVLVVAFCEPALGIRRFGQTQFTQGYWGTAVEWVWSWDTVGPGNVVCWKGDSTVIRALKPCTNTVAQSVTDTADWGPTYTLQVQSGGDTGFVNVCTLIVTGLDTAAVAKTCTLALAATDSMKHIPQRWSAFYTAIMLGGDASDSFALYGYPIKCVTTTTSAENVRVAGVVMDSMVQQTAYSPSAVDGYGRMVVRGQFRTTLTAEERRPGDYICTSTTAGSGNVGTSPAVGTVLGKVLHAGSAAGRTLIYVNTE